VRETWHYINLHHLYLLYPSSSINSFLYLGTHRYSPSIPFAMQSLLHLRNPGTKEPKFPEWMRGDVSTSISIQGSIYILTRLQVAFELYTIMCRIKMNWPTDEWMRLEWRRDLKASEPSMYIESLERKCRKVIVDDDGDEMYCDVSLLCIIHSPTQLKHHCRPSSGTVPA
jgi:hypothetical protein